MLTFNANDIRRLVKAATVPGHTGPYHVEGYDGAVFCTDDNGDVFVYFGIEHEPNTDAETVNDLVKALASKRQRAVLFRDFWRSAGFNINTPHEKLAPHFHSIAAGRYER